MTLDLYQGSHTLVLSAQGTVSPGRTATATDPLMFLVRWPPRSNGPLQDNWMG